MHQEKRKPESSIAFPITMRVTENCSRLLERLRKESIPRSSGGFKTSDGGQL